MASVIEEAKQSHSVAMFRYLQQYGDQVAIVEDKSNKSLTYSELISTVGKVSSALQRRGFRPHDFVSITGPSCMELIILQYAVLSTGATVTYAKPAFTEYELTQHYKDCQPRFIFTSPDLLEKVQNSVKQVSSCEKIFLLWKNSTEEDQLHHETLTDFMLDDGSLSSLFDESIVKDAMTHIAYMPYSSGTTGLPKGVMWTHYGMNCSVEILKPFNVPTAEQIVNGVQTPLFLASGIQVISFYLNAGVKIVILPEFEPQTLLRALTKHKINRLFLAPHLIICLMKYSNIEEFDLRHLHFVLTGTNSISCETIRQFIDVLHRANSPAFVRQSYALSEAGMMSTFFPMKEQLPNKEGSVGKPLPGTEMKIVQDDEDEPLGPNIIGNIWFRHSGIMLGYKNQPVATKNTITSDGWLKTGDVGYYDEDGYFYIVGREKDLFKCNGNQVSPAEIEMIIQTHPSVKDAAVIAVPHEDMHEVPMAFVVKKDKNLTENEIQQLVAGKLSSFKHLHGGVKFIKDIPRNVMGKVLRNELRALAGVKKN